MTWSVHEYAHDSELVKALAHEVVQALSRAIAARGRASIAVSGGSTPVALFKTLSDAQLEWDKVVVTLVDERWVPETDADSNARLVRTHLLVERAASARFVSLKTDNTDPFLATFDVEATLHQKVLPLDVVLLGMGEDGHTASFFPAAKGAREALETQERVCCAVRPRTAPHDRMTLSLATILSAAQLFLHIIGEPKKQVLDHAMNAGSIEKMPVRAVLHQDKVPLQIYYAKEK